MIEIKTVPYTIFQLTGAQKKNITKCKQFKGIYNKSCFFFVVIKQFFVKYNYGIYLL